MATHDLALLDALEDLPTQHWRGRVWRHMFNEYPPERANESGARWNPRGVSAIYTALDRDTALAEGQHAIDVQPRRIFRRRVLYEVEVDVNDVVDLSTETKLTRVALTMDDVRANAMTACQKAGGAAAWLDRGGLLVPSARNNGVNLVLFVGTAGEAELTRVREEIIPHGPPTQ